MSSDQFQFQFPSTGYVIFTGPGCYRCEKLKKDMHDLNLSYTEVNVREDLQALAFLKSLGYGALPQLFLNCQPATLNG